LDIDTEIGAQRRTGVPGRVSAARRLRAFIELIKSLQTALLLATGTCAYVLSVPVSPNPWRVAGFVLALLLSISGCTAANMIIDRDIDSRMGRTHRRPLPSGVLSVQQAGVFAALLSVLGLGLAFALDVRTGAVIATGFAFDLGIYSMWLKRRSPLSVVFGGVSGGMPALAGRVLAIGRVDTVGILFVLSVLLWIPSHIMTLSIKYSQDYASAGVPVWPNVYGEMSARRFLAGSNLLNVGVLVLAGILLQLHPLPMALLVVSGLTLVGLAVFGMLRPGERSTWLLFKAASIYMLLSFLLITYGVLL
jgi:heme o synthase